MFFHRPRAILIQLTLLLALGFSACASFGTKATPTPLGPTVTPVPPTATPEPMALTVNGEGVSVAEFQAELARYKSAQTALGKTVSDADASKTVIEDLIAQVLLAQGAKAAGFDLSESALQSREDALANQLGGADKLSAWESGRGYTDASFRTALKRSAEAAWMRDKIVGAVSTAADQVHAQQILIFNADDAQTVFAQLKGGADFNELALKYDPNTRGDLGWFPKGFLLDSKIEAAAFSLQAGQFSEVIQTDTGFHIIKVLERDSQHQLSPDAFLSQQKRALRDWVAQQRAQAAVVLAP
ncbi:MAG: peptidylprolyl isomerase [Chloroflexi bacterium]|nr:peptidylprolyl isomerase [Chloroflexota bacterium]